MEAEELEFVNGGISLITSSQTWVKNLKESLLTASTTMETTLQRTADGQLARNRTETREQIELLQCLESLDALPSCANVFKFRISVLS